MPLSTRLSMRYIHIHAVLNSYRHKNTHPHGWIRRLICNPQYAVNRRQQFLQKTFSMKSCLLCALQSCSHTQDKVPRFTHAQVCVGGSALHAHRTHRYSTSSNVANRVLTAALCFPYCQVFGGTIWSSGLVHVDIFWGDLWNQACWMMMFR